MVPVTKTLVSNIVISLSYKYVNPAFSLKIKGFPVPFCLKHIQKKKKENDG